MSGIVLSASVRQNLLSLQSTADLLATTQNRLSTGKKVNTALDNPTNFFTAQALDNRASDINNLLDGISNGVQVLQAANTGITSLQKLVDTAKSIANQALQTTVGYSTKSNVSTTISGAHRRRSARHHHLCQRDRDQQRALYRRGRRRHARDLADDARRDPGRWSRVRRRPPVTARRPDRARHHADRERRSHRDRPGRQRPARRRRHARRQRQDHHLPRRQLRRPQPLLPTGSGVSGNIVTDGSGNSTVYLGTTAHADRDRRRPADGDRSRQRRARSRSSPPAPRRSAPAPARLRRCRRHGRRRSDAQQLDGRGSERHRQGRLPQGARSHHGQRRRQRHGLRGTHHQRGASLGSLIQDGSTLNVDGHVITFKNAPVPGSTGAPAVASGFGVSGNVVTDGNGNSTVYLQAGTVADVLNAIDLATGVQTATINAITAPRAGDRRRDRPTRRSNLVGPAEAFDRRQCRPVDHRHRQCAVRARPRRQHRHRLRLHCGAYLRGTAASAARP